MFIGYGAARRRADIKPGPIVASPCNRTVLQATRLILQAFKMRLRSKLVTQPGIEIPAFDVIARPIVHTGIAKPASVDELECAAKAELPYVPIRLVVSVPVPEG